MKKFISTTVTTIEENEVGILKILESKTTIEILQNNPSDNTKTLEKNFDSKNILADGFILSESQKTYHYVALGKNSNIQLPKGGEIKIVSPWFSETIRKTHKTQQNRIDKMSILLNNVEVGEYLKTEYYQDLNLLCFSKIS